MLGRCVPILMCVVAGVAACGGETGGARPSRTYGDHDGHADPDANRDPDGDTDRHGHPERDSHRHADCHRHGLADPDGGGHPDAGELVIDTLGMDRRRHRCRRRPGRRGRRHGPAVAAA